MKIYLSLCPTSCARDGNGKGRGQVCCGALIHSAGWVLEGSESTALLDKGVERAQSWQAGSGEGSRWKCRKLIKSVFPQDVLFFSDFL